MKKIFIIFSIFILLVVIMCMVSPKKKEENVEDVQVYTGKIALYFKNSETNELEVEYRNIAIDRIKNDMSKAIMEEVLNGPTNPNLCSTIPKRNQA